MFDKIFLNTHEVVEVKEPSTVIVRAHLRLSAEKGKEQDEEYKTKIIDNLEKQGLSKPSVKIENITAHPDSGFVYTATGNIENVDKHIIDEIKMYQRESAETEEALQELDKQIEQLMIKKRKFKPSESNVTDISLLLNTNNSADKEEKTVEQKIQPQNRVQPQR